MEFRLHANDSVRHFKGGIYTIMAMGVKRFRNGDPYGVAYVRNCDGSLWLRPYDMFISEVDREKYPDVKQRYRMEKIEKPSLEETTIAKYDLFGGEYTSSAFFKLKGTDEIYILISNNHVHTETNERMAMFIGINDEIISYMPYEEFKEIMIPHTVTEENLHELEK